MPFDTTKRALTVGEHRADVAQIVRCKLREARLIGIRDDEALRTGARDGEAYRLHVATRLGVWLSRLER